MSWIRNRKLPLFERIPVRWRIAVTTAGLTLIILVCFALVLGSVVWAGLHLLRVKNPHVHMTSWAVVLLASCLPLLVTSWLDEMLSSSDRVAASAVTTIWP